MTLVRLSTRLFKAVFARLQILMNPAAYARSQGVRLGRNVKFYGATPGMFGTEPWLITLGDNVHVVGGCRFVNHDGGVLVLRHDYPDLEITKPIVVGNNVYLGMNVLILPGVTIGDNVVVGAGSVVTRDIPSGTVAVGVPARVIKSLDQYLDKVQRESLGLGRLQADAKAEALMKHFGVRKRGQ